MAVKQYLEKIESGLSGWRGIMAITAVVALIGVVGLLWWLNRGDWVYPEQINSTETMPHSISSGHTIGQTFVAKQAGLQGIGIKVAGNSDTDQELFRLRLYSDPNTEKPILETSVKKTLSPDGVYIYFQFPPLADSRFHYYYFAVDIPSAKEGTAVNVFGAPLNTYLDGSAYENGEPFDAQLAFHLNYERHTMAIAIFQNIIAGIPAALATLVMLLIPGGAVLIWLRPKMALDGIEWLAVAVGTSLAVIPVFMTYLRYLPFALNTGAVWFGYGVIAILFTWGVWKHKPTLWRTTFDRQYLPAYLAFTVIFLLSLVVRLQVVTGLEIPLWADSYHHTIISQLIVDNGKIVTNWEPYAPLTSLNYHYGFHTMVAIFHWLTGLTVPKSVIFFGQILNALAVLMAYLLGRRFGENVWVGVIAALITGLLSKYPMFYVNWGRYTQLAGQILLPVLVVLTWELLRRKKREWRLVGLNTLLVSALFLTHYRVILFYPAFVVSFLLVRWYQARWKRLIIIEDVIRLFAVFATTSLLVMPRMVELMNSRLWVVSEASAKAGMANAYTRQVHNAIGNLFDFLPPLVVIVGWMGLGLGGWERKKGILSMGMWWLMLLVITNPQWLKLPGAGQITNFAIFIGAYIIFSVLASYIFGEMAQKLEEIHKFIGWIVAIIIICIASWGSFQKMKVLDLSGMEVTTTDLRAMVWIKKHVPEDAIFLINSRLAYGDKVVVGGDAGWWIPLLTRRATTVPPMTYGTETPQYLRLVEHPRDVYLALATKEPTLSYDELKQRMKQLGLNYIYVGQQRGHVWWDGSQTLDSESISKSSAFETIYAKDGVRIFQIKETR